MTNKQNTNRRNEMETTRTKPITRGRLMNKLNKAFPKGWFKIGEDYGWPKGCILTGESSMVESKGYEGCEGYEFKMFQYFAQGLSLSGYEEGVWPEAAKIIKDAGWLTEWHDAGTVHLFKQ